MSTIARKCSKAVKKSGQEWVTVLAALTFGVSFLGLYLRACIRILDLWVMCLGVSKEVVLTCVGLSDTCVNKKQMLRTLIGDGVTERFRSFSDCEHTGILEIPYCTEGPEPALRPIDI